MPVCAFSRREALFQYAKFDSKSLKMLHPTSRRALLPFFILFFCIHTLAQNKTRNVFNNASVYTGIEVGSKGVKMSIIEIGKDAQVSGAFNILKDTSVNTDFISFTSPTFSATLQGFVGLYNLALREYKIPARKIFTVISSGVKMQADKDQKQEWITHLIDSFKLLTNEPQRKVDIVDVEMEAKLSHLGIVPASRRYNTFLLDIGSGNTKGGFFPYENNNQFRLFQLNWGTKSMANATDKKCEGDNSLDNYTKQLNRLLATIENSELIYSINASGAYPASDNIAFSGGIAWAVATMTHPEMLDNPVVTVTFEDVRRFADRLVENFKELSPAALASPIIGVADRKAATAEVARVQKVFDQRSLIAGTGLLLRIMRQFESVYTSKNYYLIKNGQVGWVSAYVDETIAK